MTTLDELIDQCPATDTTDDAVRYVLFARPEFGATAYMQWWLRNYIETRRAK